MRAPMRPPSFTTVTSAAPPEVSVSVLWRSIVMGFCLSVHEQGKGLAPSTELTNGQSGKGFSHRDEQPCVAW